MHNFSTEITLIDCPPAADILTINALVASDYVIVPVIPEAKGLDGLFRMVELVEWLNDRGVANTGVLGCVITQIDWRTNLHNGFVQRIRDGLVPVLAEIPMAKGRDQEARLAEAYKPLVETVSTLLEEDPSHA